MYLLINISEQEGLLIMFLFGFICGYWYSKLFTQFNRQLLDR